MNFELLLLAKKGDPAVNLRFLSLDSTVCQWISKPIFPSVTEFLKHIFTSCMIYI